jgi:hypothetical protein
MRWGATIGIAFLTAIAGAASAGYLASRCVEWYRISSFEGGSGFFVVYLGLLGLIVGLVAGAVIGRVVHAGFWIAQGYALLSVVGVCLLIGFFARKYGEVAPEIDGDQLILDVELKCPRGWQPDNKTRSESGSICWLEAVRPGVARGPQIPGSVNWKKAREVDGQWIVPCSVWLFSSRENRYVRVILGNKTDVSFLLELPEQPGKGEKQWSAWTNEKFSYPIGGPPVTDYFYRCRVERKSEIVDEDAVARSAVLAEREKAVAALPDDAPILEWLPWFEDIDGGPSATGWGGADRRERRVLGPRVLELGPLLASKDRTVMRRAVYALGALYETPPQLVEPLANAGRLTVDLIKEARAKAPAPDDPDVAAEEKALQYFHIWRIAVMNAGPAEFPKCRSVLEEIQREASVSKTGPIEFVARTAREDLEKLGRTVGSPPAAQ